MCTQLHAEHSLASHVFPLCKAAFTSSCRLAADPGSYQTFGLLPRLQVARLLMLCGVCHTCQ